MAVENIDLFAKDHAIEVVNFAIVFRSPLDSSDEARLEEHLEGLQDLFAAIDKPDFFRFVVGNTPPTNEARPVMYQFNDFSRDGKPEWSAQFGENAVAVSCRKYTNWNAVWKAANSRLNKLLDCVDEFKPVASIEYSVTDTFTEAIQQPTEAKPQLLASNIFKKGSWVPETIAENSDPRWDFQAGKFSPHSATDEILERVEANSVISGQRTIAKLTNSLSLKYRNFMRLKELTTNTVEDNALKVTFDKFHGQNKTTISEILSDELTSRMGL